jgi:hypothetical protein
MTDISLLVCERLTWGMGMRPYSKAWAQEQGIELQGRLSTNTGFLQRCRMSSNGDSYKEMWKLESCI